MRKLSQFADKLYFLFFLGILLLPKWVAAGTVDQGLSRISGEFSGNTAFSSARDVPTLIAAVIRILLWVGGAIAVLFVIIGGYQYLTSGGNDEAAEKGKKTVTNALIGIVLIVLAYVIVNVVVNQVSR